MSDEPAAEQNIYIPPTVPKPGDLVEKALDFPPPPAKPTWTPPSA